MAQILVTPKELRATATTLREHNSNLKTQVTQLESAESSLNSQWEGPAHDAFHVSFMNDKAYMDKFIAEIEKYCYTLEQIALEYEKNESLNVDTATTRSH